MHSNIFICSKPLQILVSLQLSRDKNNSLLFIINKFNSAEEISESQELRTQFERVELIANYKHALISAAKLKPHSIYIDNDLGLKLYLYFFIIKIWSPKTKVFVYEEGIGTYRQDMVRTGLKSHLYQTFGVGCNFGGSIFTHKIFVFNKEKYTNKFPQLYKKTIQIKQSLPEWLKSNEDVVRKIFCKDYAPPLGDKNLDAYVYLTDWEIQSQTITQFESLRDSFIKPHPHISEQRISKLKFKSKSQWVPAYVPAEILIIDLASRYKTVHIKHNNSSAVDYTKSIIDIKEMP